MLRNAVAAPAGETVRAKTDSQRVLRLIRVGDDFTFVRGWHGGRGVPRVARMVARVGKRIVVASVKDALTVNDGEQIDAGCVTHIAGVPIDSYSPPAGRPPVYIKLTERLGEDSQQLLIDHFGEDVFPYIGSWPRMRRGSRMLTLEEALAEARQACGVAR